jgi:hypothetical protein
MGWAKNEPYRDLRSSVGICADLCFLSTRDESTRRAECPQVQSPGLQPRDYRNDKTWPERSPERPRCRILAPLSGRRLSIRFFPMPEGAGLWSQGHSAPHDVSHSFFTQMEEDGHR